MSSYAIIIGINHYTPPTKRGLKTLQGAINDSQLIYNWITTEGGVDPDNVELIQSTADPLHPIKHKIDRAISTIIGKVIDNDKKNADRLYFYFAGHGMGVEKDRENNGMCMADWDTLISDAATLSSAEYKKKFINEGLFKEVVMWMDCCRKTDLFLNPQGGPGIRLEGPNTNPRIMVAFATEYKNAAREATFDGPNGPETRGVFTQVLLEGLNGGVIKKDGYVDGLDLINYLDFNIPIRAQEAGFDQTPEFQYNLTQLRSINF